MPSQLKKKCVHVYAVVYFCTFCVRIMLIYLKQRKLKVTKLGSLKSFDILLTIFFTWIGSMDP